MKKILSFYFIWLFLISSINPIGSNNYVEIRNDNVVKGVNKNNPLKNAQIGDVLCLTGTYNEITENHTMIYAGNGYVWECTFGSETNGKGVRYQKFDYQYNWYKKKTTDYNINIYRKN